MAVKWSLFYANWYQPPWTDPKICPHSRTLRKFGKNHISPHGQTPLKFGKPHESLVTPKPLMLSRTVEDQGFFLSSKHLTKLVTEDKIVPHPGKLFQLLGKTVRAEQDIPQPALLLIPAHARRFFFQIP